MQEYKTTENSSQNALLNNSMPSDQSAILQMLVQQNQLLTQMLMQKKQHKTTLKQDGEENLPHFTYKELKTMPTLKDFTIRRKNGIYFELRYRRYGYDVSFSSKNFDEAKKRAFEWLRVFEAEIQEK